MFVWGVTPIQLAKIVRIVSAKLYKKNIIFKNGPEMVNSKKLTFALTVKRSDQPGGRRTATGRKVAAACWHAHRDVMQELFNQFPKARIKSSMADHCGKEEFENNFPETAWINIGSEIQPCYLNDACECEE